MIADDPDLMSLSGAQKLQLAQTRLDTLAGQLYEALLNKAQAEQTGQPAGDLNNLIADVRQNIALHTTEIDALKQNT